MIFRFLDFNHCHQGRVAIQDITAILAAQLLALGHGVEWSLGDEPEFASGDAIVNVLLEAFTEPGCLDTLATVRAHGGRFWYVATEEPTAAGFNHGNAYGMIERYRIFPTAARYADAILHLVPGDHVTAWYARHAPAAYVELGDAPRLAYRGAAIEPDHDFGFFGQLTPRREEAFERIRRRGSLLVENQLRLPRQDRDALMRRARVIVQVRPQDNVGYVSSTRCVTSLMMGRPVVAEPHEGSPTWDRVVWFSDSDEAFYDDLATARDEWRALHAQQRHALRIHLPPEVCLGGALRALGVGP